MNNFHFRRCVFNWTKQDFVAWQTPLPGVLREQSLVVRSAFPGNSLEEEGLLPKAADSIWCSKGIPTHSKYRKLLHWCRGCAFNEAQDTLSFGALSSACSFCGGTSLLTGGTYSRVGCARLLTTVVFQQIWRSNQDQGHFVVQKWAVYSTWGYAPKWFEEVTLCLLSRCISLLLTLISRSRA